MKVLVLWLVSSGVCALSPSLEKVPSTAWKAALNQGVIHEPVCHLVFDAEGWYCAEDETVSFTYPEKCAEKEDDDTCEHRQVFDSEGCFET
mmetsp:Transcript_26274/g.84998  ORF Transcript_26274/g.84998 Transcript_26274/m.84998 type:complete len:91 (+) Transcript_26274:2543-2815(+)